MVLEEVIAVSESITVSRELLLTGCQAVRELDAWETVLKVKVLIAVRILCCKARRLLMSRMDQTNCRNH